MFWGLVWFCCFCNYTRIFHPKYPRHFRPTVPGCVYSYCSCPTPTCYLGYGNCKEGQSTCPHQSLQLYLLLSRSDREANPITVWGTLKQGGRQEVPLTGFEWPRWEAWRGAACWMPTEPWICGPHFPLPDFCFQVSDLRANSYTPQTNHFLFLRRRQLRGEGRRNTPL